MYRSTCKAVLAAARKDIGLKAVGMTGESRKTQKIVKAERERDALRERLGIHSEDYNTNDREVKNLTSEWKAEIWELKVSTTEAKKETWPIMRSLITN